MQFAGCDNFHSEEDLSEKGEFRRSSMDKRQAVEHYDMPPRKTGVVVKFSQQKGYGFIRPDFDYMNGRQLPDIFVHRTSIVSSNKVPNLRVGQKTEYDVTLDPRTGKPHAVNVTGPNRVTLDEMKPTPLQLDRIPIYPSKRQPKPWNTSTIRKLSMTPPSQNSNAPPNPSYANKVQGGDSWTNASPYHESMGEKTRNRKSYEMDQRFMPKDMNMTVTIDNDLPPNNLYQSHRQHQSVSMPNNDHWQQRPYSSYQEDYHHSQNPHQAYNKRNPYSYQDQEGYGNQNREYKLTSPTREQPEYEQFSRRDYWRYEQENYDEYHQYHGYDHRQHQSLGAYDRYSSPVPSRQANYQSW